MDTKLTLFFIFIITGLVILISIINKKNNQSFTASETTTQCVYGSEVGTCKPETECTNGYTRSGLCPGASNIKCCFTKECKTTDGKRGECKNISKCSSGSYTVSGLCPGPSDVKCCVSNTPEVEPDVITDGGSDFSGADIKTLSRGWVVSVGDSILAGTGGRWAGNTNNWNLNPIDALGDGAYENLVCNRSLSAPVHIGDSISTKNFACHGAVLYSDNSDPSDFRPGVDFFNDFRGKKGQALLLQDFAVNNKIDLVVISLGANIIKFSSLLKQCMGAYMAPGVLKQNCKNYQSVKDALTQTNLDRVYSEILTGYKNVISALRNAGQEPGTYTILVQTYASLTSNASGNRYPESGYTRQTVGGCGFTNTDLDFINSVFLPTLNNQVIKAVNKIKMTVPNIKIKVLDNFDLMVGRRLCENGVNIIESSGLRPASWTNAQAVDRTEWANQIRTASVVGRDYELSEGIHPNYWGQLAQRNCIRQAYNNGNPRGGKCTRDSRGGKNLKGEPNMILTNIN